MTEQEFYRNILAVNYANLTANLENLSINREILSKNKLRDAQITYLLQLILDELKRKGN